MPTADRRPQADGGQPTVPSPALTLTPSPTPTPTAIPQPPLESFLDKNTQKILTDQGWKINWDKNKAQYTISQLAFDEANKTFTDQTTHEVGYIDLEGNLHFTATQYSASENPDGTWKDTSTTQDIVIDLKNLPKNPDLIIKQQLDENGNPISFQEQLKTPGFHLLETKNPAFEKTGILTLTYLDENGIPQTVTFNRELNFLQIPEISTDFVNPTPFPVDYIHTKAAHQILLLQYGDGQPLPTDGFPGWSIRFEYDETTGTKRAFLFLDAPISKDANATRKFIRFVGEGDNGKVLFPLPKFVIIDKNGKGFVSIPVEIFNPKDPQNPKDGNEKLILFPPLFTGTMTPSQRIEFLKSFPYDENIINELFGRQRLIIIATQPGSNGDGYFTVLYKTNGGGWNKVGDRRPLDSLLGMEGNDVGQVPYEGYKDWGNYHYFDIFAEGFSGVEKSSIRIYERPIEDIDKNGNKFYIPLDPQFEKYIAVISP